MPIRASSKSSGLMPRRCDDTSTGSWASWVSLSISAVVLWIEQQTVDLGAACLHPLLGCQTPAWFQLSGGISGRFLAIYADTSIVSA
jgi:hypothetical protein